MGECKHLYPCKLTDGRAICERCGNGLDWPLPKGDGLFCPYHPNKDVRKSLFSGKFCESKRGEGRNDIIHKNN